MPSFVIFDFEQNIWWQLIPFYVVISFLLLLTHEIEPNLPQKEVTKFIEIPVTNLKRETSVESEGCDHISDDVSVASTDLGSEINDEFYGSSNSSYDNDEDDIVVIKSGALYKRGKQMKSWKLRVFVLRRTELAYEDGNGSWCGSVILTADSHVETLSPAQCSKKNNAFVVRTQSRSLYLHALSPSELEDWIESLKQTIAAIPSAEVSSKSVLRNNHFTLFPTRYKSDASLDSLTTSCDPTRPTSMTSVGSQNKSYFKRVAAQPTSGNPSESPKPTYRSLSHPYIGKVSPSDSIASSTKSEPTLHPSVGQPVSISTVNISMRNAVNLLESNDEIDDLPPIQHASSDSIAIRRASPPSHENCGVPANNINSNQHEEAGGDGGRKRRVSLSGFSSPIFSGHSHSSLHELDKNSETSSVASTVDPVNNSAVLDRWLRFLQPGETIVVTAVVVKKNPYGMSHTRRLILTSTPRLIYMDPKDMIQKGEVKWMDDMYRRMEKVNSSTFKITMDTRTYRFSDSANGAQFWIDHILHASSKRESKASDFDVVSHGDDPGSD